MGDGERNVIEESLAKQRSSYEEMIHEVKKRHQEEVAVLQNKNTVLSAEVEKVLADVEESKSRSVKEKTVIGEKMSKMQGDLLEAENRIKSMKAEHEKALQDIEQSHSESAKTVDKVNELEKLIESKNTELIATKRK